MRRLELDAKLEDAKAESLIELAKSSAPGDGVWTELSIIDRGWKDEYLTIFFTALIALCFIPWTQPFVSAGFAALAAAPVWLQIGFLTIVGSTFGVRLFSNVNDMLKGK